MSMKPTDKCSESARLVKPEESPLIQRLAEKEAPDLQASSDLESRLNATKGSGAPLQDDTRSSMESAFGADFSGVRVHTDQNSVQMNQDLRAQAFTHGSDVYFNQGKYNPGTTEGQKLLGHELTHVVQQRAGQVKETMQAVGLPVNDNVGLEKEADEMGEKGR